MKVLRNLIYATLGLVFLACQISVAHADRPRSGSGRHHSTTTTTTGADPTLTTTPNCVTPTQDMAVEGRRAYMRMNCYSCHGASGHGGSMGPSLVGEADETAEAVLQGKDGGMPSFKNNLCPNDIKNLTAYLQLLGTGTEPDFVNWWETNPSQ